eukprot:scaffold269_cov125-Cylindrotheca_fusiformis.AAC.5
MTHSNNVNSNSNKKKLGLLLVLLMDWLRFLPCDAVFDETLCNEAEEMKTYLLNGGDGSVNCQDWQDLDNSLAEGDCCGSPFEDINATTECSDLCTQVLKGLGDNCPVNEQFQYFTAKNEICQIFNVRTAMETAVTCDDDWKYIIQNEPKAFCVPALGKFKNTDPNCTEVCDEIIATVPDYCIGQAIIDIFQEVPIIIKEYHPKCADEVLDRIKKNKSDTTMTCSQWQDILELDVMSAQGCGASDCTISCRALIDTVEDNCDDFVGRNYWMNVPCKGGGGGGESSAPLLLLAASGSMALHLMMTMMLLSYGCEFIGMMK